MRGFFQLTSAHPWAILVAALALALLSVQQLVDFETGELQLEIDPSTNRFLPADDEGKRFYDFIRRVFGSDETLLVVLGADDVFSAPNLRRLARMTERFKLR